MIAIPVTKDEKEQGVLIAHPEKGFAYIPSEFLIFKDTEAEAIEAQKAHPLNQILNQPNKS